jgi:hypothetical protein
MHRCIRAHIAKQISTIDKNVNKQFLFAYFLYFFFLKIFKMGNMLFSQRVGDAVAGLPEEDKNKHSEYRVFPAHMYKVRPLSSLHLKRLCS